MLAREQETRFLVVSEDILSPPPPRKTFSALSILLTPEKVPDALGAMLRPVYTPQQTSTDPRIVIYEVYPRVDESSSVDE